MCASYLEMKFDLRYTAVERTVHDGSVLKLDMTDLLPLIGVIHTTRIEFRRMFLLN